MRRVEENGIAKKIFNYIFVDKVKLMWLNIFIVDIVIFSEVYFLFSMVSLL